MAQPGDLSFSIPHTHTHPTHPFLLHKCQVKRVVRGEQRAAESRTNSAGRQQPGLGQLRPDLVRFVHTIGWRCLFWFFFFGFYFLLLFFFLFRLADAATP